MRLRHLEIVWAIARSHSMREAARLLGISQPAVSQSLKHAEDLLGYELFLRAGGRLAPSPELRALMPDLERIFAAVEEVRVHSASMTRGQLGQLSIFSIPALADDCLAQATMNFRRLHPRVILRVVSVPARTVIEHVLNHDADIGLVHGPLFVPGLRATKLAQNPVVAVLHRTHPLADRDSISVKDLGNFEIISLGRGNAPGDLVAGAFREANVPFTVAVEITTSATAITFVRAGLGVALIDAHTAATFVFQDTIVRSFTPRLVLDAEAIVATDRALPPVAGSFVSLLRHAAQEELLPPYEGARRRAS